MKLAFQSYKPSNLTWLPQIPEHWNLVGLNILFTDNKEKNVGMKESKVLSLSYGNIIVKKKGENYGLTPESFETYQVVYPGYIILRLTDLQNDKRSLRVGLVMDTGIITSAYCCLVPKKIESRYYYYFLYYLDIRKFFYSLGGGVRQSSDYNELKLYKYPFPPIDEQTAIANYLDTKTEQIDQFVSKKQKLIDLLKEQKQAIIDKAVTKGITENVKLKPSGIECIGDIPVDWSLKRLGAVGRFSKGGNISRSELINSNDGVPAILYGDIYTKYNIAAESIVNRISKETSFNSVELIKGDLLFTGSGETKEDIGKCIFFNSDFIAYAGGDVIIFKPLKTDSYFISYSQNSSIAKYQKAISSKGEIIVHTYGSKLRDVIMPYPSTIEEQQKIANYINVESSKIDVAIRHTEKEIELIKEYNQSLIAEVVTGKIKVK